MKNVKVIIAMFLIGVLALTACGKEAPSAPESTEPTETAETMVSMANPWVDCTEEEAKTHVPRLFQVPEGAENVAWSVMHPEEDRPLVQVAFDLDGLSYNARAQVTGDDAEDISGMYYKWSTETSYPEKKPVCKVFLSDSGQGICLWKDRSKRYSLSAGREASLVKLVWMKDVLLKTEEDPV